jgi:hypothetical protein
MTIHSPVDEDNYILSTALVNISSVNPLANPSPASLLAPSSSSIRSFGGGRGVYDGGIAGRVSGQDGEEGKLVGSDGSTGESNPRHSFWPSGQEGVFQGQEDVTDQLRVDKVSL